MYRSKPALPSCVATTSASLGCSLSGSDRAPGKRNPRNSRPRNRDRAGDSPIRKRPTEVAIHVNQSGGVTCDASFIIAAITNDRNRALTHYIRSQPPTGTHIGTSSVGASSGKTNLRQHHLLGRFVHFPLHLGFRLAATFFPKRRNQTPPQANWLPSLCDCFSTKTNGRGSVDSGTEHAVIVDARLPSLRDCFSTKSNGRGSSIWRGTRHYPHCSEVKASRLIATTTNSRGSSTLVRT